MLIFENEFNELKEYFKLAFDQYGELKKYFQKKKFYQKTFGKFLNSTIAVSLKILECLAYIKYG